MHKKDPKICPKCSDYYFGDSCISCKSNQYTHYTHYTTNASTTQKLLIGVSFIIIAVLIIINKS
ncbi:hypothetical protein C9926_02470 [Sulfurovum lithotrophicum]|nr:hypothetical protein C9926_02470 [Sulfurovum lithotrophicum]